MVVINNIDQESARELRINEIRNHLNFIINSNECDLKIKETAHELLSITNNIHEYFCDRDHHRSGGILSNKLFWIRRVLMTNVLFFVISLPFLAIALLVNPGNSDYSAILYPLVIMSTGLIVSFLSLFSNEDSVHEYTGIDSKNIDIRLKQAISNLDDIPSFFHFSHNFLRDFDKCVEDSRDDISCKILYISCITNFLNSFSGKNMENNN